MQYVRPFDPDKAVDAGFPGFRAQVLSHLESALMMSSHIREGGCGPACTTTAATSCITSSKV